MQYQQDKPVYHAVSERVDLFPPYWELLYKHLSKKQMAFSYFIFILYIVGRKACILSQKELRWIRFFFYYANRLGIIFEISLDLFIYLPIGSLIRLCFVCLSMFICFQGKRRIILRNILFLVLFFFFFLSRDKLFSK